MQVGGFDMEYLKMEQHYMILPLIQVLNLIPFIKMKHELLVDFQEQYRIQQEIQMQGLILVNLEDTVV